MNSAIEYRFNSIGTSQLKQAGLDPQQYKIKDQCLKSVSPYIHSAWNIKTMAENLDLIN